MGAGYSGALERSRCSSTTGSSPGTRARGRPGSSPVDRELSRQLPWLPWLPRVLDVAPVLELRQLVPGSSSSSSMSPGALRQLTGSSPAARRERPGSSSPGASRQLVPGDSSPAARPGARARSRCSSSRSPGRTRVAPESSGSRPGARARGRPGRLEQLAGSVLDVELPGKCPDILRQMSGQKTRPYFEQGTPRRHVRVRVAEQLPPGEHLAHSHTRPVSHAPFATGRSGRLVASSSRGCAAAGPP